MVTSPKEPIDKHKELAALFRAGIAGDSASYNRFLQQISILLRRVIGKRLPASDIEDVVQEILISVHKARHTYDGKRPLMPWVMAIAGFRINDHLRRLYRRGQDTVDVENIAQTLANDVTESHDDSESDLPRMMVPVRELVTGLVSMR